jgi:hypothetical protein
LPSPQFCGCSSAAVGPSSPRTWSWCCCGTSSRFWLVGRSDRGFALLIGRSSRRFAAVAAAIAIGSYAPTVVVAGDDSLTVANDKVLFDLAHGMFTISFLAFGLLMLAFAGAPQLPRLLSWSALVVGVGLLFGAGVGPFWEQAFAVILLWFAWVIAAGGWLLIRGQSPIAVTSRLRSGCCRARRQGMGARA